jgi:hypothetical protein
VGRQQVLKFVSSHSLIQSDEATTQNEFSEDIVIYHVHSISLEHAMLFAERTTQHIISIYIVAKKGKGSGGRYVCAEKEIARRERESELVQTLVAGLAVD